MVLCLHCGFNLSDEAKYCGGCGKKQERPPSVSPLSFSNTPTKPHERDDEQALGEIHRGCIRLMMSFTKPSLIFTSL